MKEPQRLLDDGANALERALLQAGDAEKPSFKSRKAAMAALGLTGAVLSAPPAAAAGSAVVSSGVALSAGARLMAAKWWAIGALVTASGAAGFGFAKLPSSPASTSSADSAPQPAPPLATSAPAPVIIGPQSSPAVPELEPERKLPPAPRSSSSDGNTGIQEQIALIDRARGAVARRESGSAMAALDEYQRRFPGGVLAQEAALLRIETLVERGDRANATRLGRQFLARYPRSAMAARVRTLIDG